MSILTNTQARLLSARVDAINARMVEIETIAPEHGRGPLWHEYDQLMSEWDEITATRNALARYSR